MSNTTHENMPSEPRSNDGSVIGGSEKLLTLTEATKVLPRYYNRRVAVSTIWRWCRKGIRGVHLEYLRIGRNIMVSQEALARFFVALVAADKEVGRRPTPSAEWNHDSLSRTTTSSKARAQSIAEAEAILAEAGI